MTFRVEKRPLLSWCLVHEGTDRLAVKLFRTKKAALAAKARLEALDVDWVSTKTREFSTHTSVTLADPAAMWALEVEQVRILHAEFPTRQQPCTCDICSTPTGSVA